MKFFASKNMSLFCFFLNCTFAYFAIIDKNLLWFLMSLIFAIICLYNYKNS